MATVPLTDNLDTLNSCVFEQVKAGSTTWYFCRLCSRNHCDGEQLDYVGSNQSRMRVAHLADPIHVQRAALQVKKRNQAIDRFFWSIQHKKDVYYYRSAALDASVCRYIFDGSAGSREEIERLVETLRLGDPMVQLELALWKAACELSPPGDSLSSPLEWKSWSCRGWKQLKSKMRRHPLTGITALVAPFLGLKKGSGAKSG